VTAAEQVVDTNVVSYLLRNSELSAGYRELLRRPTGITVLSLAELNYGVVLNEWGSERLARLDEILSGFSVLPAPAIVAELCGHLRAARHRVGRPIELADAWIAATALWFDIPVVTHDRDLEAIPGLRVRTLHGDWVMRGSNSRWSESRLPLRVGSGPRGVEEGSKVT
jgi:tRNA(fMet)-specific endonuclease VapC